jgi:carbonic anhydrase
MITLQNLVNGYGRFQKQASPEEIAQWKRLRDGQSPEVLMIICSDSRVHLERILQYKPGEVFTIRNAGNVVPRLNSEARGELGTLQFAVEVLKIKNIVVCGHSDCGAVKAALNPTVIEPFSHLKSWIAEAKDGFHPSNEDDLNQNIQKHILNQIDRLSQLDFISSRVNVGALTLSAWMLNIGEAEIISYCDQDGKWRPLDQRPQPYLRDTRKLISNF